MHGFKLDLFKTPIYVWWWDKPGIELWSAVPACSIIHASLGIRARHLFVIMLLDPKYSRLPFFSFLKRWCRPFWAPQDRLFPLGKFSRLNNYLWVRSTRLTWTETPKVTERNTTIHIFCYIHEPKETCTIFTNQVAPFFFRMHIPLNFCTNLQVCISIYFQKSSQLSAVKKMWLI